MDSRWYFAITNSLDSQIRLKLGGLWGQHGDCRRKIFKVKRNQNLLSKSTVYIPEKGTTTILNN